MTSDYRHQLRVAWADTDAAGVVHFARYLIYCEAAEHALFRSLSLPLLRDADGTAIGWPRVHVDCDYRAPLRFDDLVTVQVLVKEVGARKLAFTFRLYRGDTVSDAALVATAAVTTVCVRAAADGTWRAAPLPAAIGAALAPAAGSSEK